MNSAVERVVVIIDEVGRVEFDEIQPVVGVVGVVERLGRRIHQLFAQAVLEVIIIQRVDIRVKRMRGRVHTVKIIVGVFDPRRGVVRLGHPAAQILGVGRIERRVIREIFVNQPVELIVDIIDRAVTAGKIYKACYISRPCIFSPN